MTTIRYSDNGDVLSFSATGHAEYARKGEPDIVCASVSAFTCLLASLVSEAYAAEKMVEPMTIQLDAGNVQIICSPKRRYYDELRGQFRVIMTGLQMLAEQYSNHVRVAHLRAEKEIDR